MTKTILITGATDGIGRETARRLVAEGHRVLLHGRNGAKLDAVAAELSGGTVERYVADLSRLDAVEALAGDVAARHDTLDALINNAGVFKTPDPITDSGLDVRFVVNTLAPYLLTMRLMPLLGTEGRVVNLSSAAQAPVDAEAMAGRRRVSDMEAYAQSKRAITQWSRHMGLTLGPGGPVIVAVNPGSLLASKMVKEGFGVAGSDLGIGADILIRAALADDFADAQGAYFDNDAGRFARPHPDETDPEGCARLVHAIEDRLATAGIPL